MGNEEIKFGQLREIKNEELILMLSWRNSPNVRKNMYTQHEIMLEEHLDWWSCIKNRDDSKYLMFEMNETPLGIVGFTEIDRKNKNSFWAFYAAPDAPRGTGSKMEYLALNYAFNKIGLHKLQCEVLAFNDSVIKLHKRFGFKVEGVFKEQYLISGNFVDTYRLGILKTDWNSNKNHLYNKIIENIKRNI